MDSGPELKSGASLCGNDGWVRLDGGSRPRIGVRCRLPDRSPGHAFAGMTVAREAQSVGPATMPAS